MMPPHPSSGTPGLRLTRRELLRRASNGFGSLALGSLLSQSSHSPLAADSVADYNNASYFVLGGDQKWCILARDVIMQAVPRTQDRL